MKTNILATLLVVLSAISGAFAQGSRQDCLDQQGTSGTPQIRTYFESQDCAGAIALCALNNRYATGYICGNGNIESEVPTASCLRQNENNTTWYTFKVRTAGRLKFFIIPLDQDTVDIGGDQGQTDYDWALYKLPAGQTANLTTCAQLTQNISWEVACNYSGARGTTGMHDTTDGKFDASIQVSVGETFVLVVDNFTGGDLIGYQIRFFDPVLYPTLADIRAPNNPARFDTILEVPNCLQNELLLRFTNAVKCEDLDEGVVSVTNLLNPALQYSIDTIYPVGCVNGYTNLVRFRFSPLQPDTNYAIILTDTIRDICGNFTFADTLRFRVNPFIRLESYVDNVRQDSVCSGQTVELRATPDESLRSRTRDFTYEFFYFDTLARTSTPIIYNDSTIRLDTNSVYFRLKYPTRTRLHIIVRSTSTTSTCRDNDTTVITINPLPTAPLAPQFPVCYGDQITVAAGADGDTGLYKYDWRSRISTRRFPQRQQFNLTSDTINEAAVGNPLVRRAQHDDLTLIVTYRPQFGGCAAPVQRTKLLVGARLRPRFIIDTLTRPGKTQIYVADTAKYVDISTFFSGNGKTQFRQSWLFGEPNGFFIRQGPSTDTVKYLFSKEGPFESKLIMYDTVSKFPAEFICSAEYVRRFEVIFPEIPNIITPDGDGKNDYFDFVRRMPGYELHVYNRWGREVYKTDSYANDFSAPELDNGFYFYNMKPTKGTGRDFKGWLHVVKKQ